NAPDYAKDIAQSTLPLRFPGPCQIARKIRTSDANTVCQVQCLIFGQESLHLVCTGVFMALLLCSLGHLLNKAARTTAASRVTYSGADCLPDGSSNPLFRFYPVCNACLLFACHFAACLLFCPLFCPLFYIINTRSSPI